MFHLILFTLIQPIENKVPISAQKKRPSSSAKVKQNSIISATESTKEEQVQHRISSSKIRNSVQVSGSQEKIANLPSETSLHNEEQNKLETSNYNKETKKNGISEETKERQQSAGKSEQMPMSELAGFQNQTSTETT